MKQNIFVIDPPYSFSDRLTMSNVARGAESNYSVMNNNDLLNLRVKELAADDALLALWVPSTLLPLGLDLVKAYGFTFKQVYVWVKVKKDPAIKVKKALLKNKTIETMSENIKNLNKSIIDESLAFGMGRIFRNVHEMALIGTRGKISKYIKNKSQRTVSFDTVRKHSEKPEDLQNSLDAIFSDPNIKKMEIFARRVRPNWTCIGNECLTTLGQDVRDTIDTLIADIG